jgi:hypothetical protein
MVFVDNDLVVELGLRMEDLEIMYQQPDKYRLSNHLRNKVLR